MLLATVEVGFANLFKSPLETEKPIGNRMLSFGSVGTS